MIEFDKDTRAGLCYGIEQAVIGITGMYDLTPVELKSDPVAFKDTMPYGAFLVLGMLTTMQGFLLEEDDTKCLYLIAKAMDKMDAVIYEALGVSPLNAEVNEEEMN